MERLLRVLCCQTAAQLGPALVSPAVNVSGCRAFLGYNADFEFDSFPEDTTAAQSFLQCDWAIDLALASGRTPQQALQSSQTAFNKAINDPNQAPFADTLRGNLAALTLLPPTAPASIT
jgi:hypothetical protein